MDGANGYGKLKIHPTMGNLSSLLLESGVKLGVPIQEVVWEMFLKTVTILSLILKLLQWTLLHNL